MDFLSRQGSVFSILLLLLTGIVYGIEKKDVGVIKFQNRGSGGIIISEEDMTRLFLGGVDTMKFNTHLLKESTEETDIILSGSYENTSLNIFSVEYTLEIPKTNFRLKKRMEGNLRGVRRSIAESLNSLLISLKLNSKPQGVAVYLDDKLKGNTPITLSGILKGRHLLKAEKPHFISYYDTLDLKDSKEIFIRLKEIEEVREKSSPKKKGFGYLEIYPLPWCRVYLDDMLEGSSSLKRIKLPTGTHDLVLVSPRFGRIERKIEIRPDKTLRIEFFKRE